VASPVSPISPINQTSTPVPTTTTAPVTATPSAQMTSPSPTVSASPPPTTGLKIGNKTLPLVSSFELLIKPSIVSPNLLDPQNISQEFPREVIINTRIYMDLITNGSLFKPDQSGHFDNILKDQMEFEQ
jgi:hypothetical protein